MSLIITPLLKKNLKDALKIYNYYIDNSFSNFEEKKSALVILQIIIKILQKRNYLI